MLTVDGVDFELYDGDDVKVDYHSILLPEKLGDIKTAVSFFQNITSLFRSTMPQGHAPSHYWKMLQENFWIQRFIDWKNGKLPIDAATALLNDVLKKNIPSHMSSKVQSQVLLSEDASVGTVSMSINSFHGTTIHLYISRNESGMYDIADSVKGKADITRILNQSNPNMSEDLLEQNIKLSPYEPRVIGFSRSEKGTFFVDSMLHVRSKDSALLAVKYHVTDTKIQCGAYCFGNVELIGSEYEIEEGDLSQQSTQAVRPRGLILKKGEWKASSSKDVLLPMTREEGIQTLLDFVREPSSNILMNACVRVYPCGEETYILHDGNDLLVIDANNNDISILGATSTYGQSYTPDQLLKHAFGYRKYPSDEVVQRVKKGFFALHLAGDNWGE